MSVHIFLFFFCFFLGKGRKVPPLFIIRRLPPSQNTSLESSSIHTHEDEKRDVPTPPLQRSPPVREDGVLHERQSVLGREHHKKEDSFKNTSTERGQHSGKGEERLEGGRSQKPIQREIRPVRVLG